MKSSPAPLPSPSFGIALVAALLASVFGMLLHGIASPGRGLDAPDLDYVLSRPDAARVTPLDRVWFRSTPPELPDLGRHRPMQATLLHAIYRAEPGRVDSVRRVSVLLYGAWVLLGSLFVARFVRDPRARFVAAFLIAAHPMATEATIWPSAIGATLMATAWVGALLAYQMHLERRLAGWIASPCVAVACFVACGAHEQGYLLPLALVALDLFSPVRRSAADVAEEIAAREAAYLRRRERRRRRRGETAEGEVEAAVEVVVRDSTPLSRLLWFGVPAGVAVVAMFAIRLAALDGSLGATTIVRPLGPDAGVLAHLLLGLRAFARGWIDLLLPFRPQFLHPERYGAALLPPFVLAALVPAAGAAVFFLTRGGAPRAGIALAAVPLVAALHWAPMSDAYAQRWLLVAIPGIALAVAASLDAILLGAASRADRAEKAEHAEGAPRRPARSVRKFALVAAAVVVVALVGVTRARVRAARYPNAIWSAEAERHPNAPQPLAFQMVNLVSRPDPKVGFRTAEILELADKALDVARPPDADLVHQYLGILHLARRKPEDFDRVFETAFASPGPHLRGFYGTLGATALGFERFDSAEKAARKELEVAPDDFNALFTLARAESGRKNWEQAVAASSRALTLAPTQSRALVQLLLARALRRLEPSTPEILGRAIAAFEGAIEAEPQLTEAYLDLARLYIQNGYYPQAEQTLALCRERVKTLRTTTYADIYRIQVESLEKQERVPLAIDLLNDALVMHPNDVTLRFYAGDYLIERGALADANRIFKDLSKRLPNHPAVLYGNARLALERENRPDMAELLARKALAAAPGMRGPLELLHRIDPSRYPAPPPRRSGSDETSAAGGAPSEASAGIDGAPAGLPMTAPVPPPAATPQGGTTPRETPQSERPQIETPPVIPQGSSEAAVADESGTDGTASEEPEIPVLLPPTDTAPAP